MLENANCTPPPPAAKGRMHKIPRAYRGPYGFTGKMTPGRVYPPQPAVTGHCSLFSANRPSALTCETHGSNTLYSLRS